jgi:hypothetical protein
MTNSDRNAKERLPLAEIGELAAIAADVLGDSLHQIQHLLQTIGETKSRQPQGDDTASATQAIDATWDSFCAENPDVLKKIIIRRSRNVVTLTVQRIEQFRQRHAAGELPSADFKALISAHQELLEAAQEALDQQQKLR